MRAGRSILFVITIVCMTAAIAASAAHGSSTGSVSSLNIGVLADYGKDDCLQKWTPTSIYLEKQLPEYDIHIVCLGFDEIEDAVVNKLVDFTITNPSVYVNLEYNYGVTRIATIKNRRGRDAYTESGGVIFYKTDREDITSIEDLKGKKFMAVSENSFGGWLVSWNYLKDRGLDPYTDFQDLRFSGSHDAVVMSVLNGVVDVGCIRTDTLERMAWEGRIDIDDFDVFDLQDVNSAFDFLRTTRLYPEWPLAKAQHTPQEQAKQVLVAMMQMPPDSQAARSSRSRGWTIPMEYHDVHGILQALQVAPYEDFGTITYWQLYQQYKLWIYITALFLICSLCGLTIVFLLNRRLNSALVDLDSEHQERELLLDDLNEFKLTLDQTLDCVFMFSADTLQYIYVNQGALKHIGYSRSELLSMTPLDIKPNDTKAQFKALIKPLEDNTETSLTYISSHQRKDGTIVPVEVFLQLIRSPRKKGRFVAIVRDITIRLEREEERKQLQTKLLHEQKLASVGQLAAGIAHEINTPAQYLGSNVDFLNDAFSDVADLITHYDQLLSAVKTDAVSPELLATVEDSCEEVDWPYLKEEIPEAIHQSIDGLKQISSIVLAMKNFSHPGSSEKEMTNLNELIETTLTVCRSEWKLLLEPVLHLDHEVPTVLCMRNEIGQVFLNMIINGAHSIQEKLGENSPAEKGQITISSKQQNNTVILTFTDSGCGISGENITKIFDPFFTTKSVGKGTGQGLTISYDIIVNKHGGSLDVASEEGVGTTFTIVLPINSSEPNGAENNDND